MRPTSSRRRTGPAWLPENLLAAVTVLVALVAVGAVVDVSVHAPVFGVGLRLRMTVRTGEDGVVIRVGMATCAYPIGSAVIHRKIGMVERRIGPGRRVVTSRAGRRESRRLMVRIGGAVVVSLMAAIAIGGQRRVVVVHVAVGAGHRGMCPGQRERRVVVIERRIGPRGRAVAHIARCWETHLNMVRVVCVVVVRLVATDARRVSAGQLIVAIHVALRALQ